MDIIKVMYYLTVIKESLLDNYGGGYKGYLSKEHYLDLFLLCVIRLETQKEVIRKTKNLFGFIF